MDYFISDTCENLTYVSGAKDPGKLILNVDGIPFHKNIWRINSKSETHSFPIRLGGMFVITWSCAGKDIKGNNCTSESAGFGISDNSWGGVKRSFGLRSAHNHKGDRLTEGKA